MTTPITAPQPIWFKAIAKPAAEFSLTPLKVIAGKIPEGLNGSLYRNGPARFTRGGGKVDHWFDGDGAILAVHFREGQAVGTYRYVKTQGFLEEAKADALLYGGYGTLPAVSFWNRFQPKIKNAANTSVLVLPDRLLALWEGGKPHRLTLEDLETLGLDDVGWLGDQQTFSAHPKQDPQSGEIYNFGVGLGRQLFVYRCDRHGKVLKQVTYPLKGIPLIHDFVLAGRYLVFCISPVRLQNPLKILVGLSSYSDCLKWKPNKGTQLLIFNRETLELVSQHQTDPWFQWHFGNGFETEAGNIILTLSRYEDFQTNQFLKEVVTGDVKTMAAAKLWQCELKPDSGRIVSHDTLVNLMSEFPTVSPRQVGKKADTTYLSLNLEKTDRQSLLKDIGYFHHPTGQLITSKTSAAEFPTEPLFAPDPQHPERGWILTVVYDGDRHQSEVWLYEGGNLTEPICRILLPCVVPMGFHGKWSQSSQRLG